jgi:hypothetical protein
VAQDPIVFGQHANSVSVTFTVDIADSCGSVAMSGTFNDWT